MNIPSSSPAGTVRVWDLPLRLFHWLLAASFTGAFLTAESDRWREVHVNLGYAVLVLVAFRLLWGIAGPRHARFADFVHGPAAVVRYVGSLFAGRPEHHVGHNPAGGWAIVAMLFLAVLSGATGWATLNEWGGGEFFEEFHEGAANTMLALVIAHVAAVIASSVLHRENLVRAMITGRKRAR